MTLLEGWESFYVIAGIHNAWDIVTYQVFVKRQEQSQAEQDR